MKRIFRIIFSVFSWVSLFLCILCLILWVRNSHGYLDIISATRFQQWSLGTNRGMLVAENRYLTHGLEKSSWRRGMVGQPCAYSDHWTITTSGTLLSPEPIMLNCTLYRGNYGQSVEVSSLGWTTTDVRYLATPFLAAVLAMSLLPLISCAMVVMVHYKKKSIRSGLCAVCGYDLRATLDRCPECGSVPKNSMPAIK